MAETMLVHGPQARDGGERYQVVVVVDAEVLAGDGPGRSEIEHGPSIAPETARRLSCDAAVVVASVGGGGEPLDIGRRSRSIPRHIRRALTLRDRQCRFPGCTQRRFVDGHHIQHWSQGGPTSLANLILLCRAHHRLVHEGGFALRAHGNGRFSFTRPDGLVIPDAPAAPVVDGDVIAANRAAGVAIGPDTGTCLWNGERLDLALALDALLCLEGKTFS